MLYPSTKRQAVLQLLEQHITDNIVKVRGMPCPGRSSRLVLSGPGNAQIGNEYYRQVVGIPQGSILSSLLCSFFYGDLERRHLGFTGDASSVRFLLVLQMRLGRAQLSCGSSVRFS